MDRDARHFALGAEVDEREQMLVDRMDTTVADEAHEMDGPIVPDRSVARIRERLVSKERPIADRVVDANQVLHDDAPSAKVEVPDLAVSHLPLRETDGEAGRVQQGTRASSDEGVPSGSRSEGDSVSFPLRPVTPAVEYDQHNGTLLHDRGSEEGFLTRGSAEIYTHAEPAEPGSTGKTEEFVAFPVSASSFGGYDSAGTASNAWARLFAFSSVIMVSLHSREKARSKRPKSRRRARV